MALTVVWEKCAVDNPATGESKVLNRGESLPDFVSDFVRSTLVQIGAVRDFGAAVAIVQDAADAELAGTRPVPPPVLPPEVPPVAPATPEQPVTPVDDPPATDDAVRPQVSDNKETWERYAVGHGYFTQAEAESMTKAKLVAEVTKRENA